MRTLVLLVSAVLLMSCSIFQKNQAGKPLFKVVGTFTLKDQSDHPGMPYDTLVYIIEWRSKQHPEVFYKYQNDVWQIMEIRDNTQFPKVITQYKDIKFGELYQLRTIVGGRFTTPDNIVHIVPNQFYTSVKQKWHFQPLP